ncbi:MAG TPA: DoxX family protein [Thermoanaerobaculia bacterium]|nr:DoxX family protein [Thermoanaerobaculia bacterium]
MTIAEPTNPIHPRREAGGEAPPRRSTLNVVLWVLQVLLGLLFIWAGGMKLVMPLEKLAGPVDLPGWFVRFIGVVELLGGLGLILPGLLRIRTGLTPLAAAGLVIVMIGAVGITLAGGGETAAMAVIPAVTGLLAAFIAYGRWRLVPLRSKK